MATYREYNEAIRELKKSYDTIKSKVDIRFSSRIDRIIKESYDSIYTIFETSLGDDSRLLKEQNDFATVVSDWIEGIENVDKIITVLKDKDRLVNIRNRVSELVRSLTNKETTRSRIMIDFYSRKLFGVDYRDKHVAEYLYCEFTQDLLERDVIDLFSSYLKMSFYISDVTNDLLNDKLESLVGDIILSLYDEEITNIDRSQAIEDIKIEEARKEVKRVYTFVDDYKELCSLAEKNGFEYIRSNGDHRIYRHSETLRIVVIPAHSLRRGLSIKIQKDIEEKKSINKNVNL